MKDMSITLALLSAMTTGLLALVVSEVRYWLRHRRFVRHLSRRLPTHNFDKE
jgi:hypothetical protein